MVEVSPVVRLVRSTPRVRTLCEVSSKETPNSPAAWLVSRRRFAIDGTARMDLAAFSSPPDNTLRSAKTFWMFDSISIDSFSSAIT